MHKLRSLFPNMDALIVFEATARLSSFSQAAKELNVTAPAVSQQIKGLEQTLKVRLFARGHRSVLSDKVYHVSKCHDHINL